MNLFKQIKAFLLLSVLLFALGHNAFPHVHHQHELTTQKEQQIHHHSHDHGHQHGNHQHEDSSQDWKDLNFLQVLLDGHSSTNHTHQYTPVLLEPLKSKKQLDQKVIHNFGQVDIVVPHKEVDLKPVFNALICPYDSVNLSINPLRGPPSKV